MSRSGSVERRTGRRPGSTSTREAILAAASRHFAERGYDRASLRAIAGEAGVNHRLIAHFFGSKQQLFVVAVGLPLNPAVIVPQILSGDPSTLRRRISELLVLVLDQPDVTRRMTAVIRAAASDPDVARMLREFLGREVFEPASELLGGADSRLRMNLAASQLVGVVMARSIVGAEPLASTPAAVVATAVAPAIERYLRGPLNP